MNTKRKFLLFCGTAVFLSLLGNTKKVQQVKSDDQEQKLTENIYQYLQANDSIAEKYLEQLKYSSVDKVQNIIINGKLTAYTLQQNKNVVSIGAIHGVKFPVNDKEYTYSGIVPVNYNSAKQYALIIHLHGTGRTGDNYIDKWQKIIDENKTENYILICPTFPDGKWSSKAGEEFVLTLIQKIKTIYNIDDNRIFLTGMSRGGGGTYNISKFHTDIFAGIAPIAGATDIENKAVLLENFLNLPIYIIHGSKDNFVPVEYARNAYQKLKDLKCDVTYIEHDKVLEAMPSIGGHFYPVELLPDLVKWFDTKKRKLLPSQLFIYQTKNNHERMYWVSATTLMKDTVSIQATLKDNHIEIKTEGVKKLKVFLNKELVSFIKPVSITMNGKEVFNKKVIPDVKTLLRNYKQFADSEMLFTAEIEVEMLK